MVLGILQIDQPSKILICDIALRYQGVVWLCHLSNYLQL
jgi:hypothetical protein